MSRLSVIVPCYNYGRFLTACLASVLEQEGVDTEVLVIDDASNDDSWEVAARIASADRRVEVVRHQRNWGLIATLNEGVAWARGEYTVALSADDALAPGAFFRAVTLLNAHPNVGFVYGGVVRFTTDALPDPPPSGSYRWEVVPGRQWLEDRCRDGDNIVHAPTAVVRTRLLRELGGYRAELPRSADMEMWLRLAVHADVGRIKGVQAFYRVHKQSMERTRFADPVMQLEQTKAAYDLLLEGYAHLLADEDRLRRLAYDALARNALGAIVRAVYRREVGATRVGEIVDFALRVRAGASPDGVGTATTNRRRLLQLPRLTRPALEGLREWPWLWRRSRDRTGQRVIL